MELQVSLWCPTCKKMIKSSQDESHKCPTCESNLDVVRFRYNEPRFKKLVIAEVLVIQFVFLGGRLLVESIIRFYFSIPQFNPFESAINPILFFISFCCFVVGIFLLDQLRRNDEEIVLFDEESQDIMGTEPVSFKNELALLSSYGCILALVATAAISLIALLIVWNL